MLKSIIRVAGVNQNIEVAGCKSKTINLKKMLKSAIELKQTAKLGDSMLLWALVILTFVVIKLLITAATKNGALKDIFKASQH